MLRVLVSFAISGVELFLAWGTAVFVSLLLLESVFRLEGASEWTPYVLILPALMSARNLLVILLNGGEYWKLANSSSLHFALNTTVQLAVYSALVWRVAPVLGEIAVWRLFVGGLILYVAAANARDWLRREPARQDLPRVIDSAEELFEKCVESKATIPVKALNAYRIAVVVRMAVWNSLGLGDALRFYWHFRQTAGSRFYSEHEALESPEHTLEDFPRVIEFCRSQCR